MHAVAEERFPVRPENDVIRMQNRGASESEKKVTDHGLR
jgi:hypothetical protein